MTDQDINEAVAELCGWKKHHSKLRGEAIWKSPSGCEWRTPPDYVNNLNACTEFENLLGIKQQNNYAWHLRTARAGGSDDFQLITSGPKQRCEALLRMHGKWRET